VVAVFGKEKVDTVDDATLSGGAGGCPTGMAYLPGGSFKMGERGDQVTVAGFCMNVTEVTVDAYAACRASTAPDTGATATGRFQVEGTTR
jgi:hypothetical protein